jgi:hypothetical protein
MSMLMSRPRVGGELELSEIVSQSDDSAGVEGFGWQGAVARARSLPAKLEGEDDSG